MGYGGRDVGIASARCSTSMMRMSFEVRREFLGMDDLEMAEEDVEYVDEVQPGRRGRSSMMSAAVEERARRRR